MTPDRGIPTIAEAARQIKAGILSPVSLTETCLDRIEKYDPTINAFHTVFIEEARATAKQAESEIEAGNYRGPLHGIPIGIKDVFYMKGYKTTSNSRVMAEFEADEDAAVITKLRDAGAILIGQLNTYEFTFGGRPTFDALYPPARNPWNIERSTGGSSSGSGSAVAAGFCLGALGSDAGGSIRTPSAFCGIAGMKATYGRVSAFGDLPLSFSFDCVGPMTWTSEDSALMLQVLAGYDERDPGSVDTPVPDYVGPLNDGVRGLKVGVIRQFYTDDFEAPDEIVDAIDGIGETLKELGATIGEVNVSPLGDWHAVGRTILPAEAFAIHEENLQNRWEEFGPLARNRMMLGSLVRAVDYIQAQRRRTELLGEIEAALAEYDILITTAMLTPQPPLDDKAPFPFLDVPMIAVPFNLSLHPVQTVRAGFFDDGMPIGAQIVGRNWDETTVLKVAHAFEKQAGLLNRCPKLA
ncbi:MAG: Asp-tRNA(Asn)/Glu-tRNA(Gln) amidotransferase GatCAB subunit A [Rhodospirillaceae bacterium]|nr:Asp-tRNA(Asn)/Glu-tRNA(Gln) amidotransferase GatCAB subunit A [Rhodospirillaceae bacterium]|tara:strand:- start:13735 stop:15135 length:1401 start_codon:yes stop_codon:yes gene_type:complete